MKHRLTYKKRQIIIIVFLILIGVVIYLVNINNTPAPISDNMSKQYFGDADAISELNKLPVKGRAPRTGYTRKQFGDGWGKIGNCSTREVILYRDLEQTVRQKCRVMSGILHDPYTGQTVEFQQGPKPSQDVQIDHVVALSDAWQKGAQQLDKNSRVNLANDPLNLLAVDGKTNQAKSDSDAATWLPPNKSFRCQYVSRQVAVKKKYELWVTAAEKDAIMGVLQRC